MTTAEARLDNHPYGALERRWHRMSALSDAAGVLGWDMSTVMPTGGAEARTEQLAALDVICHQQINDPALADLLDAAEAEAATLDPWQTANLREMRREWRRETALQADLVEALSRACKRCEMAWREARPAADFAGILTPFENLLALVRESAEALGNALGLDPYDALLDGFAPGTTAVQIDNVFQPLAAFLPDFIEQVLARQAAAPQAIPLEGPFPVDRQEALSRSLMGVLGFDFAHGRLDVSAHPFTGGVPDDVRITTRYDEADFMSAMMATLHETGHALYERGLPANWRLQPVGESGGMALHESQSLIVEMQACRSAAFVGFVAPLLREAFGADGPAWQADNLLRLVTKVERGFIRVDADEVTYPAHIILRSHLERAMIAGDLAPADLPGAWNDGLEGLLGIRPENDRLGCLQDIHWYDGAFGYFPTYTLGAMIAAQLFAAAREAHPEIPEAIGRGDFAPLLTWLGDKIHGQGSLQEPDALLIRATGKPLDPAIFQAHLKRRYLD